MKRSLTANRRALAAAIMNGLLSVATSCAVPSDDDALDDALAATPPPTGYAFSPTGVEGAGFQNVVAIAPGGSTTVLAGADVAGVHRSVDRGVFFVPSSRGISSSNVAALLYHPTRAGKVYAAVGRGGDGAFLVSTDDGATWTVKSTVPKFHGGNSNDIVGEPQEHPRSTGNLIGLDRDASGAETLYVATFDEGVLRSTTDGSQWTSLGLAGHYLRSIAVVRSGGALAVYAASHGRGIWKWTPASGGFTHLVGSPSFPEEMVAVGATLYVAAGTAGIFRSTDGGASWVARNAGISLSGPNWLSIAGYAGASGDVVYAGCRSPASGVSLVKSVDGGATWAAAMKQDTAGIHTTVGGPTGATWWLSLGGGLGVPAMLPGHGSYVAAHIAIDPANRSRLMVAGRSAIWGSTDGGANWYPMVGGLGVTVNMGVTFDPHDPRRIYVANMDWHLLVSRDGLDHVQRSRDDQAASVGFAAALDSATNPSTVLVGSGNRDKNIQGGVFSNPAPEDPSRWMNENLPAQGNRPLGVAVARPGGTRVILAAVEEAGPSGHAGVGGVYRKAGSTWTRATGPMAQPQPAGHKSASFAWMPGTSLVYLYDRATGVWRSTDAGRSWTRIWSKPSTAIRTGNLLVRASEPHRLYVSAADGVYRLDNADTGAQVGSGVTATELGALSNSGEMAFEPGGHLLVTTPSPNVRLLLWDPAATTWRDLADDLYRGAFGYATGLAIAPDGTLYVALSGNGVLMATPVF